MKELEKRHIAVLDNHDWSISGYTNDGRVELEKYSPAGEDFIICVEVENFPEAVAECAARFDIDEHIEMWIEAKKNGVDGVPSTRELVNDAEAIDKMLQELAVALMGSMIMRTVDKNQRFCAEAILIFASTNDSDYATRYYPENEVFCLADVEKIVTEAGYERAMILVIAETALHGKVFRYGNHNPDEWEEVGTTDGYA